MKIYVTGGAVTRFGELWDVSPRKLAKQAVEAALAESLLSPDDVDALFVGNMLSGILGGQEHLGSFFADELGLKVPAFKVEGACASGGLAFHAAYLGVMSGQYRRTLVLGIEKMTDHSPDEVATALMGAGSDAERIAGASFPALYALLARAHMTRYSTTEKDLAAVAVKNHYHASLNKNAQYRSLLSIEDVLKSAVIASPLKLYDCSPISDGAAAVVVSRDKKTEGNVEVLASEVATDTLGLCERETLTELRATKMAAGNAFKKAGLKPEDVSVAEVHDCFTIAEILAMEDLGFYQKGKAAGAISSGETRLGASRNLVVNTSGGLKACGHPVGATGVKQIVEIYQQLTGRAQGRQLGNPRIGLTHNVGGSGATAVVNIFR